MRKCAEERRCGATSLRDFTKASLIDSLNQDQCNCYLSWDRDAISATSEFYAATGAGPADVHGAFDEHDRAAIHSFVQLNRGQNDGLRKTPASHTGPYLPLTDGEIRVLELYPAASDTSLEGRLHVVRVDFAHAKQSMKDTKLTYTRNTNHAVSMITGEPVWYTALSYVWGAPIFDQRIVIGDDHIAITSSLAAALISLRSITSSIFLWVDQICINQPDIQEKVQQIPLMGLIYTHATNTIIWLGEDNGQEPELAFEIMDYIHSKLQLNDMEVTPGDFERLDFPPADHRSWLAISLLFQRPWLSRLWTIQEAVLSRRLFVKCGEAVVCFDDLAAWCHVLEYSKLLQWLGNQDTFKSKDIDVSLYKKQASRGGAVINALQSSRIHNMTLSQKEDLLSNLVNTRYAQATEPKDKIYGVLGISNSSIVPDYSAGVTVKDVYEKASLTQVPQSLFELLHCVDHDTPLVPSWVPDWSTDRVTEALGYSTKATTLYRAGGRQARANLPTIELSSDKKRVTISGLVFDSIMAVGNVIKDATLDIDDSQNSNEGLASCVQFLKESYVHAEYPMPSTSIYDAFWQTLVAGRDGSGTAAPTIEHSDVFSLILDSTTGEMPSLPGQTYSIRRQKGFFTLASLRTRRPAKTLEDLRTAIRPALTMRRFAITQQGYFALVPRGTREGDEIVIFQNACVPFVVREAHQDPETHRGYRLLGEAYVHGIMKGEAVKVPDVHYNPVTLI